MFLWQLWTIGQRPFADFRGAREVLAQIEKGCLPTLPDECPESMFEAMSACWTTEVRSRPTAHTLRHGIYNIMCTVYADLSEVLS